MSLLSPAQRHRARILQQQAQATSPYGTEVQGDAYDLMRIKLGQDKARLSTVQSIQRRAELKAQLLPEYLDWINTALSTGNGATDRVLTTLMVWCLDAGAYALGLEIAAYVIAHKMPMADEYKRSPAAIVIDELANAYLRGQWKPLVIDTDEDGANRLVPDPDPNSEATNLILAAMTITQGQDAPDQARAKLHKALAYSMLGKVQTAEDPKLSDLDPAQLAQALENLHQALQLDAGSGVKKDIERLERALGKTSKAAAPAPTPEPAAKPAAKTTRAPRAAGKSAKPKPAAKAPKPKARR